MIYNYFKIAFRNFKRNKIFSIINILGLTLGISISILIVLFVYNDMTYDTFHKDSERIYRISTRVDAQGSTFEIAGVMAPLTPLLNENYPKIESAVRMTHSKHPDISYNNNTFEEQVYFVSQDFFDVFTVDFIYGQAEGSLDKPFSLIITEETSKKIFKDENPVGKIVKWNDEYNYTIKAVIKKFPENSHIKFDGLASFQTLYKLPHEGGPPIDAWIGLNYHAYIKITEDYTPQELEEEFKEILDKYFYSNPIVQQYELKGELFLQPLERIHLYSKIDGEFEPGGDITNIMIFSAIAIFILIIACINFMNLSTARSTKRMKEVGMRKVLGAIKPQLRWQFLIESIFLSLISLILAVTLAEILLPEFNTIISKDLKIDYINNWQLSLGFLGLAILVGFIAGSYPAFYLSSFRPVEVLKGKLKSGVKGSYFRSALVVIQFVISIILISCTGVIYKQLNFVKNKDMGFNRDQVVVVRLRGDNFSDNPELLKNELASIPEIKKMALSAVLPGRGRMETFFKFEGHEQEKGKIYPFFDVDEDFIDILEFEIITGRGFSNDNALDKQGMIINQAMVKERNWNDPIGQEIMFTDAPNGELIDKKYRVIGVINDFHYESLHSGIRPLGIRLGDHFSYLLIKLGADNIQNTIKKIEDKYYEIEKAEPFSSFFLNETFNNAYKAERRLAKIFFYFTFIAIFIACLGLFGLASYTTEQRTKEIGIRKILGSSVKEIVGLLTKNFLKLVLISAVIAIPVAWYLMHKWLENFTYHIDLSWWIFAIASLIAVFIALITVITQAALAANENPVNSIKYE